MSNLIVSWSYCNGFIITLALSKSCSQSFYPYKLSYYHQNDIFKHFILEKKNIKILWM